MKRRHLNKPSPRQHYEQALRDPAFSSDPAQARAVDALQRIYEALIDTPPRALFGRYHGGWTPVRGLYLWGGVGRGKTFLMDAFFAALPFTRKRRDHFHRFMLDIHARRRQHPDTPDPLRRVADEIALESRVLCFDEFFVGDIADAMILSRLFERLFERGVTLVATSNVEPSRLYENGLQRAHFLPFIDVLQQHVDILAVAGDTDYRLRALTRAEIYHHPCDAQAESNLERWFAELAPEAGRIDAALNIHDRVLHTRRLADGVAWFDFAQLCETPRSAADYVEIARTHHTVLLSRIPQMGVYDEDAARRFVHLVDAFYDRNVKLILAAQVSQTELYGGEKSRFEFARTLSRLTEMQSREYLARPHLA